MDFRTAGPPSSFITAGNDAQQEVESMEFASSSSPLTSSSAAASEESPLSSVICEEEFVFTPGAAISTSNFKPVPLNTRPSRARSSTKAPPIILTVSPSSHQVFTPRKRSSNKNRRLCVEEHDEDSIVPGPSLSESESNELLGFMDTDETPRKSVSSTRRQYEIPVACALCQLSDGSRFGQGRMDLLPAGARSPFSFEVPNSLREKQLFDDLSGVGHESIKTVSNVLTVSGELPIHENCMRWSSDVEFYDGIPRNVDAVVENALYQLCSWCGRYGSTVKCCVPQCTAVFHLPCVAASDSYQQLSERKVVCTAHLESLPKHLIADSSSWCAVCGDFETDEVPAGTIKDLLFCFTCGRHMHVGCLGLPGDGGPVRKAGWQCQECKTCTVCHNAEKNDKAVVCCDCGRDYHLRCLVPALGTPPKAAWKCPCCRACTHCGKRTPGGGPSCKWHQNYSICDSCYQQKVKGSVCTICQRAYRFMEQKDMLRCVRCAPTASYTHRACDPNSGRTMGNYECIRCLRATSQLNGEPAKHWSEKEAQLDTAAYGGHERGKNDFVVQKQCSTHLSLAAPYSNMSTQIAPSPSTSSVFSSSLDDSSLNEQGSEISGNGGGKPLARIKRRAPTQPATRAGKKRIRTLSNSVAPRKRGKGKTLPLIIPPPSDLPLFNGEATGNGESADDEETFHTSTVVIFKSSDEYLQARDICVSCGSVGVEDEGKLIGCAQCGQCYHSYCAGVKLSSAVLTSGWRCLDCTLCEVCGKPHDEGRLILCDECDISFHIYCLDPPLDQVPHGTWKCRRCVRCQYCDHPSPGHGSSAQWHDNYSTCTPCASLQKCPICEEAYVEQQLIIQCLQCERFLHASCDSIMENDDLEGALGTGYICPFCRPEDLTLPVHLEQVLPDEDSELSAEVSEPKPPSTHKYEGMLLSDVGLKHLKQIHQDHTKAKGIKRKPKIQGQVSVESNLDLSFGASQDSSDKLDDSTSLDDKKKRKRKPQRYGVGGFLLRGPKPKADREKEVPDMNGDNSQDAQMLSGTLSPAESLDNHLAEMAGLDPAKDARTPKMIKKKKPPLKKKLSIKDVFPDYLQDAFFGKPLLEKKDASDQPANSEHLSLHINIEQPETSKSVYPKPLLGLRLADDRKHVKTESGTTETKSAAKPSTSQSESQAVEEEEDFPDFTDPEGFGAFLTQELPDDDLLGMLMAATDQEEEAPAQEDDSMPAAPARPAKDSEHDPITDNLDSILDSLESDLPQMSSEDAEEIFNDVFLVEESTTVVASGTSGCATVSVHSATALTPTVSSENSWPGQQPMSGSIGDSNEAGDGTSVGMKALLKAEQDEKMGHMATISQVLYANLQHPDLKTKFPEFTERYKQITKLWRKVTTEDRQPFLQKARENRSLAKPAKAQKAKEEKAEKAAAAAAVAVKSVDRPTTVFPGANAFATPPRFPPAPESMESPYYPGPEEMVYPNPSTPLSQPSTPGSSASHPHHQQYPVGSPAPPFSPSLDRPRSVLPGQHSVSDMPGSYGVQSPHAYQAIQSPRTPYPPSSPFDPYAHPPGSVQPVPRQQSVEYNMDEHDPYAQPPGTPMPQSQRFPQPYPHVSNPQSPQNGQFYPRQQLRDLLARQNQSRQRQQVSPNGWQYPPQPNGPQQQPSGTFSPPHQVQEQYTPRMQQQSFPVQRQEFRPPPPPQPRTMQQVPRNFQMLQQQQQQVQQQRFQTSPRLPGHIMMQRAPGPQFGDGQGQMFDQNQVRPQLQQQWQQQPMMDQQSGQSYPVPYSESGLYAQDSQQLHQPVYVDSQFSGYRPPVSQAAYGPRSPNMIPQSPGPIPQSPNQPRPPMQWSQPGQQTQQFPQMPPRAQSVAPPQVRSPPVPVQSPLLNGILPQRPSEEPVSEAERQANMSEETFLMEHYHRLAEEQSVLENEIAKVRKQRKALAARQRQLKKNGNDLGPDDTNDLDRLTQSVSLIQKQLEQVRKQNKQHQSNMQDFTTRTGVQLVPPQVLAAPRPPVPAPVVSVPMQQPQMLPGMVMHQVQVRPGMMPQYHPAIGPPGQPGPYPPQNMMSPKREEHYGGMGSGQFGEQYYQEPHLSPQPRPPHLQQQRFAVPHQHPGTLHQQFTPNHPQQQISPVQEASQSFPPEPKIQPHSEFSLPSTSQAAAGLRSPQPGQIKIESLPTTISGIKSIAAGLDPAARADGGLFSGLKRPSLDSSTSDGTGDDRPNEKKNILLKQLLEHGSTSGSVSPERKMSTTSLGRSLIEDEDDQNLTSLTPAQQQQLAMIESMPLTLRKESLSGSPVNSVAAVSEMNQPASSEISVDVDDGKRKKSAKKKKRKVGDDSADTGGDDTPAEAVVNGMVERLRQCQAVTLFEPDKCSLPGKSIFVKSESDAAPVPVGKKLEDLKKPHKKGLTGKFGQFEVAKHGPKSRFYVGINSIGADILTVPDVSSSATLYEECVKDRHWEAPVTVKQEPNIKREPLDKDRAPLSPAFSYVSSSSYGETRLLEPCYDRMYDWLEVSFPPDGPPVTEIVVAEPVLLPTLDPGTPTSFKENMDEMTKSEPTFLSSKSMSLLKDSNRTDVILTITEEAARNMDAFLLGLANFLQIPVSDMIMNGYEPDDSAVVPTLKKDMKPQKFCRTCEVALSPDTALRRPLSEFPLAAVVDNGFPLEVEEGTPFVSFCCASCMRQFAINNQTGSKASPPATVSVDHGVDGSSKAEIKKEKREQSPSKRMSSVQTVLKTIASLFRRGKKSRHDMWNPNMLQIKKPVVTVDSMSPEEVLSLLDVGLKGSEQNRDSRACVLCHLVGDFSTEGPGRLLNIDGDHWVHLNCALWSSEVYETINGHLMNVQQAWKRALKTECARCRKMGATLMCYRQPKIRCNQVMHFPCAKMGGCMFFKDKSVLCEAHKPKEPTDDELQSLQVHRRVYVHRDEPRLVARVIHAHDNFHKFRVGTLIYHHIGQIHLPTVEAFHHENCIYPVGFAVTRIFWSMRALHRRCHYHCTIEEVRGKPEFRIMVLELGYEDVLLCDSTTKGVWMKVLTAVLEHRPPTMIKVFPDFFTGDDLFGLTEVNIVKAVESLSGAREASRYKFQCDKANVADVPALGGSPHLPGSARLEPKSVKRKLSDVDKNNGDQSMSEGNLVLIPHSVPTAVA